MALLKISNDLYFGDKDLMNSLFRWLKQEHEATIINAGINERVISFYITGKDIPEGEKDLDIICTSLVKDVVVFEIKEL